MRRKISTRKMFLPTCCENRFFLADFCGHENSTNRVRFRKNNTKSKHPKILFVTKIIGNYRQNLMFFWLNQAE